MSRRPGEEPERQRASSAHSKKREGQDVGDEDTEEGENSGRGSATGGAWESVTAARSLRENEWQQHLGALGKRLDIGGRGDWGSRGRGVVQENASKRQVDQALGWSSRQGTWMERGIKILALPPGHGCAEEFRWQRWGSGLPPGPQT
jgi:hypothetical protein